MGNEYVDLSISIVSWNTRDLVDQCLESVYANMDGVDVEVIVVDNASSDDSVEMVRRKHPRAVLIENSENVGFARANNQAFEQSHGRHFMLLNSDAIVLSSLAPLVKFLDENESVGVASCKCVNPDHSIQKNWFDYYPSFFWEMLPERIRNLTVSKLHRRDPGTLFDTKWVGGQCMTVRRQCIERTGSMDPGFFMYSEETDWCCRIGRAGWRICHFPSLTVMHLGGQSTKLEQAKMLVELYRSKTRFIRQNGSALHARAFKVGLAVRTTILLALSSLRGGEQASRLGHLLRSIHSF